MTTVGHLEKPTAQAAAFVSFFSVSLALPE